MNKKKKVLKNITDWLIHLCGYIFVFILVTSIFDSIYIDENNKVIWSIVIVLTILILNKTIKPILVKLTIPITGLTLGLFYPCINVFILKIVDWILGKHFIINNIFIAIFAAILLSIMNFIMNEIIDTFIIKKVKKNE